MPSSHHRDACKEKFDENEFPLLSVKILHVSETRSYLLQSVVELHRLEQEALLVPQRGADLLAHSPQLAALRPDGVLGIVGVLYQPVTFTGQGQGTVQNIL